ncbi:oligosaccharide repeat unit polymerase [Aliarcobacter skirrowii]|uniref:O-antigen polymerase n=1 Tax=Aliarcobacter skirrowii TaxID=28200 RepID=UPI000F667E87|nr:O-antigen polymerase [Aliarcobacter skirrowii]AZL54034.1 oligosaccharide repeat unit polymerase [Aliarcobacter skirrowii]
MSSIINGVSEFVISLSNNYLIFFFILCINSYIFYYLIRRYVYALIDPVTYLVMSIVVQLSVLIYISIFFISNKNIEIIIYCYLSNILFISSFLLAAKKIKQIDFKLCNNNFFILTKNDHILFIFSFILFVLAKFYIHIKTGIQIDTDEQLSYYRTIPYGGFFIRLIYITNTVIIFYCFIKIIFKGFKKSYVYVFLLLFIFLLDLLSAGKALLLKYLYYFLIIKFIYSIYNGSKMNINNLLYLFLGIMSFVILLIIKNNDIFTSFYNLFYRIIMFGDIYMFVIIGNVLEYLDEYSNGFFVIIKDFLGFFRIYEWDNLPQELGNSIFKIVTNSETVKGPNPLHVFFGYYYFGSIGLLFSIFSGYSLGLIRTKFLTNMTKSFSSLVLFTLIFFAFFSFTIDPSYGIQQIVNIMFIYIPIYIFIWLVSKIIFLRE